MSDKRSPLPSTVASSRQAEGLTKLADVVPFRGLRYNPEAVPDLSAVISPPYDIISPADQKRLHEKHEFNAIHLDFPLEQPTDNEEENRYTRAAGALRQWVSDRTLLPEAQPAFYLCREEFLLGDGSTAVREGFIAGLRLADFSEGVVLPHEETASGPKADRLKLMQATKSNLSAIYCLYSDPDHTVVEALRKAGGSDPDARLVDEAGTIHSLWVVDAPDATKAVNAMLAGSTLLIADGHHRYETALAYRDERRAADGPGPDQPYDFMMVYLSDMDNTGQSILPIHRFVSSLDPGSLEDLPSRLENHFHLTELMCAGAGNGESASNAGGVDDRFPDVGDDRGKQMIAAMAAADKSHNVLGMYLPGRDSFFILKSRSPRPMFDAGVNGKSSAYRSLDIAVLDRVILADILDIRPDGTNSNAGVRFVERTEKALAELGSPGYDVAFFVNPTSMEEIRDVAAAGEKMPQKSTYFYPKPITGLVFRDFRF